MRRRGWLIGFIVLAIGPSVLIAQDARIDVRADHVMNTIGPYMTGACIEDVNHEVYGGIYSQMVFGESFQEPPGPQTEGVSGMWRAVRQGSADGSFAVDDDRPFVGRQSQRITFAGGEGSIGVENRSLNRWGMSFVGGKPYDGYVWARAAQAMSIRIALQSGDGDKTYANARVQIKAGDWQRLAFQLTPNATDARGRLAILLDQPGTACIGHAFLQPGEWGRFKGLPVRKDVAEGLLAERITVMRYGGSMVNAPTYRWKQMIGPRDRRPPYKGTWYPYSSNGWGIIDFLSFCEAAGFAAVPDLNVNESPQDIGDFVEYVNGPADSTWGRRRADDGHPEPFNLKYMELGNEETIDDAYWQKFEPLAQAIWGRDRSVTPVVGDFDYKERITNPNHVKGGHVPSLAAHQKILNLARAERQPVWFDVHVWNDAPGQCAMPITVLGDYIDWLGKLSPGSEYKVCVFEENANNHSVRRALAHAEAVNDLMKLAQHVPIVCAANCLQCDGQNDNGWDQGFLFLSPERVWGQPQYYVTQMIARHPLPRRVEAQVAGGAGDALNVVARQSEDGRALVLQVANVDARPVQATLSLRGFDPPATAQVTQIGGQLDETNTHDEPERVAPWQRTWDSRFDRGGTARYTFAPRSFTIIRWERDPG